MAQSAESPHTTRRRVWTFVFCCIGVVLVVGVWPLKGYRMDGERFVPSLGVPELVFYFDTDRPPEGKTAFLATMDFDTVRKARALFERGRSRASGGMVGFPTASLKANVYAAEDPALGAFFGVFQHHNLCGTVVVYRERVKQGNTREQVATEFIQAILDGIEREIPGVTTFYNPPARQLYYDRVRPFLEKHFPKAFAP